MQSYYKQKKEIRKCLEAWQLINGKPKHLDLQSSPSEEENEASPSEDEKNMHKIYA